MELRHLRHAKMLAEIGNFAAAAARLGLTQSALSRSIQTIEDEIGMKLFDRGRGGVSPTAAGYTLLERAHTLLDDVEDLTAELRSMRSGIRGDVRFGIGPLPAQFVLSDLLSSFAGSAPDIRISAEIGSGLGLMRKVLAGSLDFVVNSVSDAQYLEGMRTRPLVSLSLALLVRRGHPLSRVRTAVPADLERYPLIGGTLPDANFQAAAYRSSSYRPQFSCDDYLILGEIAATTDAVLLATPKLIQDKHPFDKLVALPASALNWDGTPVVDVSLSTRQGRTLTPAARSVIDKLESGLRAVLTSISKKGNESESSINCL